MLRNFQTLSRRLSLETSMQRLSMRSMVTSSRRREAGKGEDNESGVNEIDGNDVGELAVVKTGSEVVPTNSNPDEVWPKKGYRPQYNIFWVDDDLLDKAGISKVAQKVIGVDYMSTAEKTKVKMREARSLYVNNDYFQYFNKLTVLAELSVRIDRQLEVVKNPKHRKDTATRVRSNMLLAKRNRMMRLLKNRSVEAFRELSERFKIRQLINIKKKGDYLRMFQSDEQVFGVIYARKLEDFVRGKKNKFPEGGPRPKLKAFRRGYGVWKK